MSPWWRRGVDRGGSGGEAQCTGAALVHAAADLGADDTAHARAVSFAVAQATREGDDHALRALAALLTRALSVSAFDAGTLVNVASALQFASMMPDAARADWVPPMHAVARTSNWD